MRNAPRPRQQRPERPDERESTDSTLVAVLKLIGWLVLTVVVGVFALGGLVLASCFFAS